LEFLYSDHVELDNNLALDLLQQADKYSIGELKNACEKHLVANIEQENYVALGQIAELIGAVSLREAVVAFIAKNIKQLKQRKDFNGISDALLRDSLVKFIVIWVKHTWQLKNNLYLEMGFLKINFCLPVYLREFKVDPAFESLEFRTLASILSFGLGREDFVKVGNFFLEKNFWGKIFPKDYDLRNSSLFVGISLIKMKLSQKEFQRVKDLQEEKQITKDQKYFL